MRRPLLLGFDVLAVEVFVLIGRSVHTDGITLGGMASTSWPFLAATAVGWVLCAAWRRPTQLVPTGVVVWATCVILGMALRVVSGQGTAVAFIAVAFAFLGAAMFGWRLGASLSPRLRRRQPAGAARSTA